MTVKVAETCRGGVSMTQGVDDGPLHCDPSHDGDGWGGSRMPAPNHRTLPTPCDRGCGPMRRCGQCRGHVHGGVVQVRAGSRAMVRWERTAQKSESPPMPYAYAGRQKASGPSTREPLLRGSGQTDSLPKHRELTAQKRETASLSVARGVWRCCSSSLALSCLFFEHCVDVHAV